MSELGRFTPKVIPMARKPGAEPPREWNCRLCEGTGVTLALRNDRVDGRYAFRCSCYRGQEDRRKAFPSWRDADKSVFEHMDGPLSTVLKG